MLPDNQNSQPAPRFSVAPAASREGGPMDVDPGVNVIALVKETERYVFLYDDESSTTLLQTLGKFAADTELSFSWYDAAVLSQKVRRLKREAIEEREDRPRSPEARK